MSSKEKFLIFCVVGIGVIIITVFAALTSLPRYGFASNDMSDDDGSEVCKLVALSSDIPEGYIVMSRQDLRENA